jgi:hypothetical protein
MPGPRGRNLGREKPQWNATFFNRAFGVFLLSAAVDLARRSRGTACGVWRTPSGAPPAAVLQLEGLLLHVPPSQTERSEANPRK